MNDTYEVNFDGLVGPTHNYAGLSHGNVASMSHQGSLSNPRDAALQGLAKMKALADLGLKQAILPPHERPSIDALRRLGFDGSDANVLRSAAKHARELLVACSSASNMWVANAATVAPSSDTADRRVHFTVANLASKFHRSIEPEQTERTLRAIFHNEANFEIHAAVPDGQGMGDEGAANHTRLASSYSKRGLHFFIYGKRIFGSQKKATLPKQYVARQSLEASQVVARTNRLDERIVCYAQQHPEAIDAGVFHNDVISVGNENVLLYHERAFVQAPRVLSELRQRFSELNRGAELIAVKVPEKRIPIALAVKSYIFNSQLVTLKPNHMLLCAPSDCQQNFQVRSFIEELVERGRTPIREVRYFDLKQSMRNGGGPACLRLRVVLTESELAAIPQNVILNDAIYLQLNAWVNKYYRDQLSSEDLADPGLLRKNRTALDELTKLLGLGSIYSFQR
ncbi:MAG: N-succinylarginine dihydrolase [Pirellulaceae bacterium]|nr:N-succinylarginine dihydrolase [Pirellulaceae bacterium]